MYLYLLFAPHATKVGITSDPRRRTREISNAGGFLPVGFTLVHKYADKWKAKCAEKRLHELLAEYRTTGEWFDCDSRLAVAMLYKVAEETR